MINIFFTAVLAVLLIVFASAALWLMTHPAPPEAPTPADSSPSIFDAPHDEFVQWYRNITTRGNDDALLHLHLEDAEIASLEEDGATPEEITRWIFEGRRQP